MIGKTIGTPFILSALILFGGCIKKESPTLKVGLIAELTGQLPAVGASCKNAAELAVEEINAAGGVTVGAKKFPLELFIEDSASKPDQSASAAQRLVDQSNVLAIIGPNSSSNAIPAAEIAEKSKVLMIAPWSTNPKTTLDAKSNQPKQYVFRACFTDIFEGLVLGKFAKDLLKMQRAAILYDVASEVLKSQSELFKKSFEDAGGKVVAVETYTTNDKDFSAQLTKIKAAAPDVVFLPSYYTDVPLQVQQAHRLGLRVPFLGSDAWSTEELIKMCGQECEGFYFCNHYSSDSANPATQKFISAFKAKYGSTPDDIAALTYDSFGLLLTAAKNMGSKLDRQALRDSFSGITNFAGVTGDIKFQKDSRDPIKGAVIMQIKQGKFVFHSDFKP